MNGVENRTARAATRRRPFERVAAHEIAGEAAQQQARDSRQREQGQQPARAGQGRAVISHQVGHLERGEGIHIEVM